MGRLERIEENLGEIDRLSMLAEQAPPTLAGYSLIKLRLGCIRELVADIRADLKRRHTWGRKKLTSLPSATSSSPSTEDECGETMSDTTES